MDILESGRLLVRPIAVFNAVVLPFVYLTIPPWDDRSEVVLTGVILLGLYLAFEVALAMSRAERKRRRIVAEEIDAPRADAAPDRP